MDLKIAQQFRARQRITCIERRQQRRIKRLACLAPPPQRANIALGLLRMLEAAEQRANIALGLLRMLEAAEQR